jgi:hypothetical protein
VANDRKYTEQAGCYSSNTVDLYDGDAGFESQLKFMTVFRSPFEIFPNLSFIYPASGMI